MGLGIIDHFMLHSLICNLICVKRENSAIEKGEWKGDTTIGHRSFSSPFLKQKLYWKFKLKKKGTNDVEKLIFFTKKTYK